MIFEPLTKLQCCPTSDGGAAAVLVSQDFLDARPHLKDQAILIAGQCMATDAPSLFSRSAIDLMGFEMTKYAAKTAMAEAGVKPDEIKVCELHDCFSANEMLVIDAMGLSPPGKAHELVRGGGITYGGKVVINPSGGLISKGHPLGASGIAQCAELVWHLRGWANNRLVDETSQKVEDSEIGKWNKLGYNPAVVAKGFTEEQATSVRSRNKKSAWALGDVEKKVEARF